VTWPPEPPTDSDARGYDAWRDDLAVPCPFEPVWEPAYTHGIVLPPDGAASFAALPSSPIQAGRSADAPGPALSPPEGWGLSDPPVDVSAPAMPGRGA
jgi:hypothetical protein